MKYSPTTQPQIIAEMCADLVDVLSDSVDSESLHTLLSIFLEISGAHSGAAFTVDLTDEIDEGIALNNSSGVLMRSNYPTASYVAQRSLRTLQNEFSVTSSSSRISYEYAFPLRVRGRAIGAVVLQMSDSHLLTEEIIGLLQSVSDLAASTIDHTHQVLQNRTLAAQLQNALNSRIILEQAKGVLAERSKTDCVSAFGELRQMARRAQLPIHQVASEIIANVGVQQQIRAEALSASVA